MARVPFHYVDLRAFSYATEDDRRVEDALRTFLPEEFPVDTDTVEGHNGDRIATLSARVENADDVRHVLSELATLDEIDRVVRELDDRVDDNCALFLRLDKQAAFGGRVRLGEGLTLRAKVEAYPADRENAVENATEVLTRLRDERAETDGTERSHPAE
ncbi:RNA-binding protein [Halobaculum sp. MBLA0147]|uniref:RNA-binding protein n=1 Tax=Halobaculum sp. MBLA0147 TaxID=3079934 RepID=UPI003523556D